MKLNKTWLLFLFLGLAGSAMAEGWPGGRDCHDPQVWKESVELARPREVYGNIEVWLEGDITTVGEYASHGIFIFEDELVWKEFLPAAQELQAILVRGDVDAFVGLSSERFLDLWRRRVEGQLGNGTPPRKAVREYWRAAIHSNKDPEGMHELFSIKNEWKEDSWWQMTYELPQNYKGKVVPAFSMIVCFNKEHRGPFRHVAFTLIKEDGKYRLADYDANWEDIGGPFQARDYGY